MRPEARLLPFVARSARGRRSRSTAAALNDLLHQIIEGMLTEHRIDLANSDDLARVLTLVIEQITVQPPEKAQTLLESVQQVQAVTAYRRRELDRLGPFFQQVDFVIGPDGTEALLALLRAGSREFPPSA
jgi:hypothetical protein